MMARKKATKYNATFFKQEVIEVPLKALTLESAIAEADGMKDKILVGESIDGSQKWIGVSQEWPEY
jgi:hypothetical protein